MRHLLPGLLTLLFLTAFATVLWSGYTLWQLSRENSFIHSTAAGHVPPLPDALGPHAHHARLLDLAARGRSEEAEAILPQLTKLPGKLQAEARYAIGNARLRSGYDLMDAGRSEEAIPHISLAKAAYREALKLSPGHHDTRLNLALAMRLVRDLPRPLQDGQEDEETAPRQLWTDLPGLPRGAP